MSTSTEAISLVARLDEMGVLALQDGQTLADVAMVIDQQTQNVKLCPNCGHCPTCGQVPCCTLPADTKYPSDVDQSGIGCGTAPIGA